MTPPANATVLRLSGITKRFGALVANDGISLTLREGEVLALLGENGAGKSTLVSILFGHYRADEGTIEVRGQPLPPGQPRAALDAGIGMVHQHFTLADNLTVLDNVLMGTEPLWRWATKRGAARERLLAVAGRFGLPVSPDARVGSLSVGERQRVEILKALYRGARILILDEPTAVLTPQESEALFDTLSQMVAQGLSVIFISHKLPEVLRVSHRVAVLRQGRLVAEAPAADTSPGELAQWMVGHAVEAPARRPAASAGACVCELLEVSTPPGVRERLDRVSLALHAGEIVAIAGVSGNGQVALAELLCGVREASGGTVRLQVQPLPADPARLVARGVARIPEDRHAVGVVGDLPVWENAVSERLRQRVFSLGPLVRRSAAQAHARRVIETFDVRGGGPQVPARSLSGGNMQKLILGRALLAPEGAAATAAAPLLIVAHQPTWGLDIGAVAYVQQRLLAARDAGAAVLLISDDLDEVMALGDRIAVMHQGHLTEARPVEAWSREAIGLAMAGHAPQEAAPTETPMRLERRTQTSPATLLLAPLAAIAFTLLVSSALVWGAGAPVAQTYGLLAQGAFGSVFAWSETLTRAVPLILTGLAATVAFKARLYNIGAEGQLYAGALAAVAVGGLHGGTGLAGPVWLLFPLMLLAAALAGALLLLGPALMKQRLGVDEVVTTLLLNFIVLLLVSALLDGVMKDPLAMGWPQSVALNPDLELARLVEGTRLHTGLLGAVGLALLVGALFRHTVLGFDIRATGANPRAAAFAGVPVTRTVVLVALLSGALAGLAGAIEVAGRASYVTLDMSPGYGYTGIVIAMLAGLNPLGVVAAAVFVAGVLVGADSMSRAVGVPTYLADVIVAVSLLAVLVATLLTQYRVRRDRT